MKRIVEFLWCKHSIEYLFCCVRYLFIRTSKLVFQVSWQKGTQCRKWNLKGCKSCFITKDIISNQKRCAFSIRISNIQRCCIAKVSSISCGTLFNQQCLYIYLSVLRNIYISILRLYFWLLVSSLCSFLWIISFRGFLQHISMIFTIWPFFCEILW